MRGINELYARLDEPEFHEVTSQHLDNVKRQLQESLRRLRMLRSGEFASLTLRNHVGALLQRLPAPTRKRGTPAVSAPPATVEDVDDFMRRLSEEIDLAAFDRSVDHIAGASTAGSSPAALRREVLVNYLGFSFWDVWTFPISEWHDLEEHREIRVDRISPIDATSLRSKEVTTRLKGAELRHFAGFLSRSVRENDYLWGRLHGAERLIDIDCDAATAESALDGVDVKKIKTAAFRSILDTEDRCLLDKALLLTVRKEIDELERR